MTDVMEIPFLETVRFLTSTSLNTDQLSVIRDTWRQVLQETEGNKYNTLVGQNLMALMLDVRKKKRNSLQSGSAVSFTAAHSN